MRKVSPLFIKNLIYESKYNYQKFKLRKIQESEKFASCRSIFVLELFIPTIIDVIS